MALPCQADENFLYQIIGIRPAAQPTFEESTEWLAKPGRKFIEHLEVRICR
jgi:hypothetical protein